MQFPKNNTCKAAIGRWQSILLTLGIEEKYLRNKHGSCPVCQGVDRYRFDDKDGRGTWICSHCGSGDGFKLLQNIFGWDFKQAAIEVDRVIGSAIKTTINNDRTEEEKLKALRDTWKASREIVEGDPVWKYLYRRTGITSIPNDIRFHEKLKHSDGGYHPAMLALMRYPDGKAASIHRTYLTDDGDKADVSVVKKFMEGKPLNSSSVMLSYISSCLGIAEGIETAIAASKRFDTNFWAATNAALLEKWVPPKGVSKVLIAGDNDSSYTGQQVAFSLARRLVRDGYVVNVQIPDVKDKDWADL